MSTQNPRGLQVLLVDDDASLRRALARAIRLAGFEVESFASAEALLARGVPTGRACLVLDIDLPGMTGAELRRALSASGRDLPTIFITALGSEAAAKALASLQPVKVLCKPFNKVELLDAIAQVSGAS